MIEKLYPNPINLQASSVYPFNEFSLQELLNKFFQTINECVESSNTALNFVKWLKEEGLPPLVEKEIEDMYNDGRLEALIDKYTKDLEKRVTANEKEIVSLQTQIDDNNDETHTVVSKIDSELKIIKSDINEINFLYDQIDYIDYIKRNANFLETNVYSKYDNWREIIIQTKINENEGVGYVFRKNTDDDFIMLHEGYIGEIEEVYGITEYKNANMIGTFDKNYPPNYFTTTIGDTITCNFTGNRIDFNLYTFTNGGLWEFILDEGTTGERKKQVSCYSDTANATAVITLFDNLDNTNHYLKGTFKGQDTSNPVNTPRGWLYFGGLRPQDNKATFSIYNKTFKIKRTSNDELLYSYSNKEFAIRLKKKGDSGDFNWIPQHNNIGTAFNVESPKLIINGVEVVQKNEFYFNDVKNVQVIQHVQGKLPSNVNEPLLDIRTNVIYNDGIINVSGKLEFLEECDVDTGYCIMTPYWRSFADKIKSSFKNIYTCKDSGNEYIPEQGNSKSFAILNNKDNNLKNYILGVSFNYLNATNRRGEEGLPYNVGWIENRNSTMGKLYIRQYDNYITPKGYIHYFDGSYSIAKLSNISQYLL